MEIWYHAFTSRYLRSHQTASVFRWSSAVLRSTRSMFAEWLSVYLFFVILSLCAQNGHRCLLVKYLFFVICSQNGCWFLLIKYLFFVVAIVCCQLTLLVMLLVVITLPLYCCNQASVPLYLLNNLIWLVFSLYPVPPSGSFLLFYFPTEICISCSSLEMNVISLKL